MGGMMIQQVELRVFGMSCAGCAAGIERKMKVKPGILDIQVDFGSKLAKIRFEETQLPHGAVLGAVETLGYEAFPVDEDSEKTEGNVFAKRLLPGLLLFVPLFILGMFVESGSWNLTAQAILASIAFVYLGNPYFQSAWHGVKSGILGMDVLVTLGAGSAFFYSYAGLFGFAPAVYFDGSIAILFFLTIGKTLEERAKSNAFSSLEELLLMDKKDVRTLVDGDVKIIPLKDLQTGTHILVPAGEIIPIDGKVVDGASTVDEALLSGEAEPVLKERGAAVFSGSRNLEQALTIEVEELAKNSTMARIANQVKSARMQKANLARIADRIAGVFVPVVLGLALITALYWWMQAGASFALLNAVSVLLIACPCALGLATPAAISVGLSTALKRGILIRNIKVIENISKVTHLVLDKTGTLTAGKPLLKTIKLMGDHKEEEVLAIAYAMEQNAAHPFATAILEICKQKGILPAKGLAVEGLVGKGLQAKAEEHTYVLGSSKFLKENGVKGDFTEDFMGFSLAFNQEVIAEFSFEDPLRQGAGKFSEFLKNSKLETLLLSGDRQEKVDEIRESFHFHEATGEVSPEDKATAVQKLSTDKNYVAMIGDGMNDSSALAHADLGISFQEGSELAKTSADLVLMQSNLELIEDSFKISYAIRNKILQNYFWAFLYNSVAIPLAMAGQLNPMIAAAAMALSSTSVVLNSLLLRRALK